MTDRERGTGKGEPGAAQSRRNFVAAGVAAVGGFAVSGPQSLVPSPNISSPFPVPGSRRLPQAAARWCYEKIPIREFAQAAKRIGLAGIDLLQPAEWDVVRDQGLACSMGYPTDRRDFLTVGFNDRANHAMLLKELERTIPLAAEHKLPNVIAMFGNRGGRTDAAAIAAAVEGLSKIKPLAEQHSVTVCVELLNSKVDHRDYQGDHTAFGVEVMKGVASPRVKLLYDIYHMQIMEGDVIRTIRDNKEYIGHIHTGGVPGRHEIDETQELNYPAIMKAIADMKFPGFVAQEFIPAREPIASLRQAVGICDV